MTLRSRLRLALTAVFVVFAIAAVVTVLSQRQVLNDQIDEQLLSTPVPPRRDDPARAGPDAARLREIEDLTAGRDPGEVLVGLTVAVVFLTVRQAGMLPFNLDKLQKKMLIHNYACKFRILCQTGLQHTPF